MKPNFNQMTHKELKAYVLNHRDDGDAIRALFNCRSPDETAIWYPYDQTQEELEEILKQKIRDFRTET